MQSSVKTVTWSEHLHQADEAERLRMRQIRMVDVLVEAYLVAAAINEFRIEESELGVVAGSQNDRIHLGDLLLSLEQNTVFGELLDVALD